MGLLDDAKRKASELAGNKENQGKLLDQATGFAKDKLGEDQAGKVDQAANLAKDKLGLKGEQDDQQGDEQQQ